MNVVWVEWEKNKVQRESDRCQTRTETKRNAGWYCSMASLPVHSPHTMLNSCVNSSLYIYFHVILDHILYPTITLTAIYSLFSATRQTCPFLNQPTCYVYPEGFYMPFFLSSFFFVFLNILHTTTTIIIIIINIFFFIYLILSFPCCIYMCRFFSLLLFYFCWNLCFGMFVCYFLFVYEDIGAWCYDTLCT